MPSGGPFLPGKMMSKTLCSLLQPMTEAHLLAFHTFKADHGGALRCLSLGVARESRHIFLSRRLPGVCADSHYEIYYCSLPSSPSGLSCTTPLLAPGTSESAVMALQRVVSSHRKGDRPITLASATPRLHQLEVALILAL